MDLQGKLGKSEALGQKSAEDLTAALKEVAKLKEAAMVHRRELQDLTK